MTKRDIPHAFFILACAVVLFMSGRYSVGTPKPQAVAAPVSSTIIVNLPAPSAASEDIAFVKRWEAEHGHDKAPVVSVASLPDAGTPPVASPPKHVTASVAAPQVKAAPTPLNIVLEDDPVEIVNPYKDRKIADHPGF